ncbi:argininosuccinate synthase-related protein [Catellatospora tritici]|uniref:argininosuccinate synthase-related protein n=1 Tax=Catellatospora tritici TaxID=2851566 RepID=UPI001C2DCA77|nr:argininosuccinate synthase-related protein [Catellatospora tritici]MBV1852828.1 argininosuccinate synthase-related protein [Catellatospora tritici]
MSRLGSRNIRCIDDLDDLDPEVPVVTLFSGGLDGMYLLHLLAQRRLAKVIPLAVDLGGNIDQSKIDNVTDAFGFKVCVLERSQYFAEQFVLPALHAQAVYLGVHPISASLSRPLIAAEGVALARDVGAQALLHTANQSQNTLRRLNGAITQLGFIGSFGSPYELSIVSRSHKRDGLAGYGLLTADDHAVSADSNLWCREFESGSLDDPEQFTVDPSLYLWSAQEADREPLELTLGFTEGRPVSIDGEPTDLVRLIDELNRTVGRFGIGRYAGLEQLAAGVKVLEVREMPAAAALLMAYRQLESAVVDSEMIREKMSMEQIWTREAVEGRWFGELRSAADAFIGSVARRVTGSVRLALSAGRLEVTAIRAKDPLYVRDREAWEREITGA